MCTPGHQKPAAASLSCWYTARGTRNAMLLANWHSASSWLRSVNSLSRDAPACTQHSVAQYSVCDTCNGPHAGVKC